VRVAATFDKFNPKGICTMTARLIADLDVIADRLGQDFIDQLTYPGIYRGSRLNVSPVLVERDGVLSVVISEADSDACKVMPEGIGKAVYGRYFDWSKDLSKPATSFEAAVRQVAGDGSIACDPLLPLSRFEALGRSGPVAFAATATSPVFLYKKARSEIEAQWLATRNADAKAFAPFLQTLRNSPALTAAMTATRQGFAPLDALCIEKDLGGLYITAPHEVEMFTGLPARACEQLGITALFRPEAVSVTVIAKQRLDRADFRFTGEAESLAQALHESEKGSLAIQKDHMPIGTFAMIDDSGLRFTDAAYVIRRWQDRRASDDTVYFIFAANAVLKGIAAARAFFHRNAGTNMVERDLVAAYHAGVARFAKRFGFAGRVDSYFDIVHSGARTLLPATAGDYAVSASDRTIKFDMGLTVADAFGCIRGVSDIARTICAAPEIEALHDRLRNILIDQLIPAIKPGMTGGAIHAIGVDLLRPLEDQLRSLGLLPEERGVDGYRRDCGHTIQRQTISSVYFLPGVQEKVEANMLGCVEYVWPIGDVLIAVEDGYLVTPAGGIPFTAEARPA